MSLSDLRKMPHLSASAVNDYLDCSLSFRFGRIDKIKPESRSDNMEFGSSVHRVLEEIYQNRMVGVDLSIKEIHESFEEHWTRLAYNQDDIQYSEGKSFDTLLLEGKELLTCYYHKRPKDNFQILAIEEPFSFTLDGCDIPIIGAFDLLEEDDSGTLIITDFKTSSRAYAENEISKNFQLTLYQLAAKELGYTDREILLRFDCLIKTKVPKCEIYYTSRTNTEERRAIRKIIEVWKGISKGVFIPNDSPSNWKCKGCSFKKHCDNWFIQEAA